MKSAPHTSTQHEGNCKAQSAKMGSALISGGRGMQLTRQSNRSDGKEKRGESHACSGYQEKKVTGLGRNESTRLRDARYRSRLTKCATATEPMMFAITPHTQRGKKRRVIWMTLRSS